MNLVAVTRFIGGILAGITAYQLLADVVEYPARTTLDLWGVYAVVSASFCIGYLLTPYVTTRPFFWVRHHIYHATAAEVFAGGIGLAGGLLVGALFAIPLSFLPGNFGRILPVVASAVLGYFGMVALLAHKQELLPHIGMAARLGGGVADETTVSRLLLLDTSAIIDGRIVDIGRTGFLGGKLVVPRFVLGEIQAVADSSDAMRRSKGRRGLEVLNRLQKEPGIQIEISDAEVDNAVGVDAKLVRLARSWGCPIITNDYNLNHVAQIESVEVLNVNQLAQALRSAVVQGEELTVRVIQEGKEPGQGVAFLEDGTMIVVEGGRDHMDQTVEIVVTKVLQTAAGRLIFARMRAEVNGFRS